jgi:hypothetical protein
MKQLSEKCRERDERTCTEEIRSKYPRINEVYMEAGCFRNLAECDDYAKRVCNENKEHLKSHCRGAT